MKTINASKFKELCLSILDNLDKDGMIITKHGKAIARLVPFDVDTKSLIGIMKNKFIIKGDIFSTGVDWNAKS